MLSYMSFVLFISSDFRKFLIPFQTSTPIIQLLHVKMMKLLESVLVKFMDSVYLKGNGESHAVNEYIMFLKLMEASSKFVAWLKRSLQNTKPR